MNTYIICKMKRKNNFSDEITLRKEIKKLQDSYRRGILLVSSLVIIPPLFLASFVFGISFQEISPNYSFVPHYVIENLRGDTIDLFNKWDLVENEKLYVNIIHSDKFPPEKITAVTNAILSDKIIEIDDSRLHKGPEGNKSIYYHGWSEALKTISPSMYNIPIKFEIIENAKSGGDIIITLTNLKNADGLHGYTKSTVDGNQILKSDITIYDVVNLDNEELATILRHEFGHALGLGHSTAPEDLMSANITTEFPYISNCNISAIASLYDGTESKRVICEK